MKKQFNRMRQLANQTVGRAEKTEPLSDDLLQVEKRLDLVKQVTHSTHKKLTACLQGQQGAEGEKRSKKLPLTMLAQCLVEGAAVLGDDSLLGKMLTLCGETEESLAQELLQFEVQIERDVVEPLFVLAEVDIPNIQKQRKHLAKLVLDMDSSRTRFHQSSKSSSHPSTLQPGAKAESLREEMEEAANRMEICRDQLSADMFSFVAKEMDYSNYFQTLIEIQAEYHRKSLEILNSVLPQIKAQQEAWVEKPSFGKSLEDHLNISGREIAFPIEACVTMLLECGMQEEGLFRVAPSNSKLKKLKASLDCGVLDVLEYSADPHAIAGALKSYLRELPEPLMTTELYDEWIQASNLQDLEKRLQGLLCACEKLPTDNLNNFRYLIKFLSKLTEYQDANKMTPGNMAIVLGPNLLWTNITEMMTTVSLQIVGIIEPIIQHADWFFPGDIEFNLTGCYGSPIHNNHNSNFSSMPSPDMDHTERRQQHDLGRRPLSVAVWETLRTFCLSSRSRLSTDPFLVLSLPVSVCLSFKFSLPLSVSISHSLCLSGSAAGCSRVRSLSVEAGQPQDAALRSDHLSLAGSKKLAPGPPKVPYGGGVSDQSAGGQPSPVSLSPTPPSTPSPYGPACPPGPLMALGASPGGGQPPPPPGSGPYSLSSPPSLAGTLTKSRPGHSKPRQRPSLPPPQPPSAPPPDPELLEGLSPGESMSTGNHPHHHLHHPHHHHHPQQQQQQQQPQTPPTPGTPPSPPQAPLPRPALRLAVALPNGDAGLV
uniref:Rho GTPase activating protein 44 n=1 Tax=Gadus morhua TaxID=8049 RepID=A0A8C5CPK7_GADMO